MNTTLEFIPFDNALLRDVLLPYLELTKLAHNPQYHGSAYTHLKGDMNMAIATERYVTFCAPLPLHLRDLPDVYVKTTPMIKAIQAGYNLDGVEIIGDGTWSTDSHVVMGKRKVPCYVFQPLPEQLAFNTSLRDVVHRIEGAELTKLFNWAWGNIYKFRRDSLIRTLRMLRDVRDMHLNLGDKVVMLAVELETRPEEGTRRMRVSYSDGTWIIAPAVWREKPQGAVTQPEDITWQ